MSYKSEYMIIKFCHFCLKFLPILTVIKLDIVIKDPRVEHLSVSIFPLIYSEEGGERYIEKGYTCFLQHFVQKS